MPSGALVVGGHVQALGIVRSLGRRGVPVYVVDDTALCLARYSRWCRRGFVLRHLHDPGVLVDWLLAQPQRQRFAGYVLFPTHDATVEHLARAEGRLAGTYRLTGPAPGAVAALIDKRRTAELAEACAVPAPRTLPADQAQDAGRIGSTLGWPCIIKPAVMHTFYRRTKLKALRIDRPEDLAPGLARAVRGAPLAELMLQQFVPGTAHDLYSCCCLAQDGEIRATLVARRSRQIPMDFGKSTTFAETVDVPLLEEYAARLLSALSYTGVAEVEFKRDPRSGAFLLLEINARTWKWHSIGARAGFDVPWLLFRQVGDEGIDRPPVVKPDVKWVDLYPDTYIALREIMAGRLTLRAWAASLRGDVEHAVASLRDPLPFVAYTLLLPYMLVAR